MFAVSDKVVCVDDSYNPDPIWDYFLPNGLVVKDQIYVVEKIDDSGGLYIVGVPVYITRYRDIKLTIPLLVSWKETRFRKLSEIQAENIAKRKEELVEVN